MPYTPDSTLADRIDALTQAASVLADYVASLVEGADFAPKRIRAVPACFEDAVVKYRGALLDALGAPVDADPEDPASLVGHMLARSAANEASAPDLASHDRATYFSEVA